MTQEKMEHIFEPFGKYNQANYLGNGVGLSICRQICEHMKGSISVESEVGQGTTFTFTMKALVSKKPKSEEQPNKKLPVKKAAQLEIIEEESAESLNQSKIQLLQPDPEIQVLQVQPSNVSQIREISFQGNLINVDRTTYPAYTISDE